MGLRETAAAAIEAARAKLSAPKVEEVAINLKDRLGSIPKSEGDAVTSFRESLKVKPQEDAPVVRKSNIERAIEEGNLSSVDRTKGKV